MRSAHLKVTPWLLACIVGLFVADHAIAQTGDTQLRTPFNSLSSASSRAPGLWLGQARTRSGAFQQASLHSFGGATIEADDGELSRWEEFANSSVQAVFDFLNDLATQLKTALALQQSLGTTGG